MSNITTQPSPAPQQPIPQKTWEINIEPLVPHRKQIATALLVMAALFAIIPIGLAYKHTLRVSIGPMFVYGVAMALVCLSLGTVAFGYTSGGKLTESQKLRMLLLGVGGLIGLGTVLLGFALPITTYQSTWGKGLEGWRDKPLELVWPTAAVIGGLLLMFVSLQLGRGMEREHQQVRRMIYGFNALFMSVLLLAVLVIPNVLAYGRPFNRFFGRSFGWTATDNTISSAMRNVLAELKEPIKVYAILPRGTAITADTQSLLENCRSLANEFTWEFIDLRASQNLPRVRGFMEKYALTDPMGLLIIRGTESEESKSDHIFVKVRDLFNEDAPSRRGGASGYSYRGENALYNSLIELLEGKMVLYFTQGHGEMSLDGAQPRMPNMRRHAAGDLSVLKQKLTERKSVEVKPLVVDRNLKAIPDDASVVIVARPTERFTEDEAKILSAYVKRQAKTRKSKDKGGLEREEEEVTAGKLILLFNPVIRKEATATMAPTGLELLLSQYNVKLGDNRILNLQRPDPLDVIAVTNPSGRNPVAKAFNSGDQQTVFLFRNVRTVEPLGQRPGAAAVEQLMLVPPRYGFWAETNLKILPSEAQAKMRDNDEEQVKHFGRKDPLCMAVAVSETSPSGAPRDMAHAGVNKETPRMVVFGSADWLSDDALTNRGTSRMDLFNSCISWVREKSSIGITIPPQTRKEYELNIPAQDQGRLAWLPLGLMLLGIIGMGTGVWVVRRR